MHPICAALWEAKLHTQSCTRAVCLGLFVLFFWVFFLPLHFAVWFIVYIPYAFLASICIFFFRFLSFFFCCSCNLWSTRCCLWVWNVPYKYICHPSILSGSCASGPIGCPSWSRHPPPPPHHTTTTTTPTHQSTVRTRGTRTNPAVIRGHNPSLLGTVSNPMHSVCLCVWKQQPSIREKESDSTSVITIVRNKRGSEDWKGTPWDHRTMDTKVRKRETVKRGSENVTKC